MRKTIGQSGQADSELCVDAPWKRNGNLIFFELEYSPIVRISSKRTGLTLRNSVSAREVDCLDHIFVPLTNKHSRNVTLLVEYFKKAFLTATLCWSVQGSFPKEHAVSVFVTNRQVLVQKQHHWVLSGLPSFPGSLQHDSRSEMYRIFLRVET